MKIIGDIKDLLVDGIKGYADLTHEDVCILEAPLMGTNAFINKDGSLTTVIAVNGSYKMMGDNNFVEFCEYLDARLNGLMGKPGRVIDISYNKDNALTRQQIKQSLKTPWGKVEKGFDYDEMLKQQEKVMNDTVSYEQAYISITTTTDILPKATAKRARKKAKESFNEAMKLYMDGNVAIKTQLPRIFIKDILNNHNSFVNNIYSILSHYLNIKLLSHKEVISHMRSFFYPESSTIYFDAKVVGDYSQISIAKNGMVIRSDYDGDDNDISNFLTKSLSDEVFVSDAEIDDKYCRETGNSGMVKVGNRYYAPIIVSSPSEHHERFDEIFKSIDFSIPFRMSISFETGKEKFIGALSRKIGSARMLKLTNNSENGPILQAAEALKQQYTNGTEVPINTYTTFLTWGGTPDEANRNRENIISAIQSWGNTDAVAEFGDPYKAALSTIPGFTRKHTAPGIIQKLSEVITQLPYTRASSPWDSGSMMFNTRDNKPWHYEIGSSLQSTWIELISAGPGSGKSVWLNASNIAFILSQPKESLPKIGIIDIGDSSKYMIDMMKELSPKEYRDEFAEYRLKFTKEYAFNPFDTVLGARYPLQVDSSFLKNFLKVALTPADETDSDSTKFLTEFISLLVSETYKAFDPAESPDTAVKYEKYQIDILDETIKKHNLDFEPGKTFMFDIVDKLMEIEEYAIARIAQSYAVPRVPHLSRVITMSRIIQDQYGGEEIINTVQKMIDHVCSEYEVLTLPTVFDISSASVVSLDLTEVTQDSKTKAGKKNNAIAYMLARYMIGKNYYRHPDDIEEEGVIPEQHKDFHRREFSKERARIKRLCMDEFHKSSGAGISEQVVNDMRLGRKYNVAVTLISQIDEDFNETMHELSTTRIIMGPGQERLRKKQKERYGFEEDTFEVSKTYLGIPNEKGSSMIIMGESKSKSFSQMVYYKTSPFIIWGISTTTEDVLLRDVVINSEGDYSKAIAKLSRAYPNGSAKKDFETIKSRENIDIPKDSNLQKEIAKKIYREKIKDITIK